MTPEPESLPTSPVEDTHATLSRSELFDPARIKTPEPRPERLISISVFSESSGGHPTQEYRPPPSVESGGGFVPPSSPAFVLTRAVGQGGHGEVHEAIQTSLGRPVAVKRIREDIYLQRRPGSHEILLIESDFRQEALLTGVLEHPNIVPVHDFGRDDRGRPLMAMKLLRGKRWDVLIREDWDSGLGSARYLQKHLQILRDVAQAVAFAHSRGVVHRDIKPAQVMVGEFGETVLMDWGLAVFVGDSAESFSLAQHALMQLLPTPENASNPAGTPAFMAPEQTRRSASDIGPATDVFLLGATLYYILTGKAPFTSPTVAVSIEKASRCDFDPPQVRVRDREIPTELAQLCLQAMQRMPADRIPSAKALIASLDAYFSDEGKRERSVALVSEVRKGLEQEDPGYREYADAVAKLNQARGLWPENDEIAGLMDRVRRGYAEAALREGDLKLALVQHELIADPGVRGDLESRSALAGQAVSARAEVLRFLEWSATVMAILVVLAAVGIVAREQLASNNRETQHPIEALIGDVRYLDEAITMSGLMAVESREPAWWARRQTLGAQMNRTFERLAASEFGRREADALRKTAEANNAVRSMGAEAMECDRRGDKARAREILHSDQYGAAKAELALAIRELADGAREYEARRLQLRFWGLLPTYLLFLAVAAYVLVFRHLRRRVPSETEPARRP